MLHDEQIKVLYYCLLILKFGVETAIINSRFVSNEQYVDFLVNL